jgi:hypothetical protein
MEPAGMQPLFDRLKPAQLGCHLDGGEGRLAEAHDVGPEDGGALGKVDRQVEQQDLGGREGVWGEGRREGVRGELAGGRRIWGGGRVNSGIWKGVGGGGLREEGRGLGGGFPWLQARFQRLPARQQTAARGLLPAWRQGEKGVGAQRQMAKDRERGPRRSKPTGRRPCLAEVVPDAAALAHGGHDGRKVVVGEDL